MATKSKFKFYAMRNVKIMVKDQVSFDDPKGADEAFERYLKDIEKVSGMKPTIVEVASLRRQFDVERASRETGKSVLITPYGDKFELSEGITLDKGAKKTRLYFGEAEKEVKTNEEGVSGFWAALPRKINVYDRATKKVMKDVEYDGRFQNGDFSHVDVEIMVRDNDEFGNFTVFVKSIYLAKDCVFTPYVVENVFEESTEFEEINSNSTDMFIEG